MCYQLLFKTSSISTYYFEIINIKFELDPCLRKVKESEI